MLMRGTLRNAEGVSKFQPRVARASALPWSNNQKVCRNPERVAEGFSRKTPVEFARSHELGTTLDFIRCYAL
jgi:hypothetical protein